MATYSVVIYPHRTEEEKATLKIEHRPSVLSLRFDSGATVEVDLGKVDISEEQGQILRKLVGRASELETSECRDGVCPAESVLEPDEFAKVRELYVGLREIPIDAAGPIVDFCLHVINVHQVRQGPSQIDVE